MDLENEITAFSSTILNSYSVFPKQNDLTNGSSLRKCSAEEKNLNDIRGRRKEIKETLLSISFS